MVGIVKERIHARCRCHATQGNASFVVTTCIWRSRGSHRPRTQEGFGAARPDGKILGLPIMVKPSGICVDH
eukprot:12370420-Prorocentrum_lima.AAC.1